ARLGAAGDDQLARPVERRHFDFTAERGAGEGTGDFAHQVASVALEDRVLLEAYEDVEIAGRAAGRSGLPLAAEDQSLTVVDSRRDLHRDGGALPFDAVAAALDARIGDDLPAAPAAVAGGDRAERAEEGVLR